MDYGYSNSVNAYQVGEAKKNEGGFLADLARIVGGAAVGFATGGPVGAAMGGASALVGSIGGPEAEKYAGVAAQFVGGKLKKPKSFDPTAYEGWTP